MNEVLCQDRSKSPRPIVEEWPRGIEDCAKREKRSRIEYLSQYEIRITFLSIGCLVNIGCKNIAFSTIKEAMEAINAYVINPEEEVEKWSYKFNNIE